MSIQTFIPQVWSARLLEHLRKNLIIANLFNRNWEGEIAEMGDTVHINQLAEIAVKSYTKNVNIADPDQLTTTDRTLIIDQGDYFNFYLNDVDRAQMRADLMDRAMQSASYGLADSLDRYLAGLLAEGTLIDGLGTDAVPLYVNADTAYELVVQMKVGLDKANVPTQGRYIVMPPEFEGYMLMDTRFAGGNGVNNEERLINGLVGRAAGFDIYISNNLKNDGGKKYKVCASTIDQATYANQIVRTEAYRREKGFDDGVKGLHVYGAKVLRPEAVAVATVNFGTNA